MKRLFLRWLPRLLWLTGMVAWAQPQPTVLRGTSAPAAFDIRRTQPRTPARQDYALLIANGTYDDRRYQRLPNCAHDVDALRILLNNRFGFTTEVRKDLNYEDFEAKLTEYAGKTWEDNDQLLIYIAGHGGFKPGINQGFLVMKDTDKARQSPGFPLSYLQTILKNLACKHILVVLDVCYGGTFDNAIALEGDVQRGSPVSEVPPTGSRQAEFIVKKLKPRTRIYVASGGKEPVAEGRPGEHSPFAKALLTALDRAASGTDKLLTVYELTSALEKDVLTLRFGTFDGNQPNSDFLFIAR